MQNPLRWVTIQNEMILMLFFLEQYKTHKGGEGATRVGMEWEDGKLIFTQTGKKKIA